MATLLIPLEMKQSEQERIEYLTQQIALVQADPVLTNADKKRAIKKMKSDLREAIRNATLLILTLTMMSSCSQPETIVVVTPGEAIGLGLLGITFLIIFLIILVGKIGDAFRAIRKKFKKK